MDESSGSEETEVSDEEANIDLLLQEVNLDDEALELPDFGKVTEDKYIDGALSRSLFQVVCSHPDVQSLVADIQVAFSKIESRMTEALEVFNCLLTFFSKFN